MFVFDTAPGGSTVPVEINVPVGDDVIIFDRGIFGSKSVPEGDVIISDRGINFGSKSVPGGDVINSDRGISDRGISICDCCSRERARSVLETGRDSD